MGLFSFLSCDRAHNAPLTLNIGGKERKMDRVRISDLAALQERIRDKHIDALFRQKGRITNPDLFAKSLAAIISEDPSEQDVFDAAVTQDGQAFLLWRCLSRMESVSEEDVREWIERDVALGPLLLQESGLIKQGEGGGGDPTQNPMQSGPQSSGPKTPVCFAPATDSGSKT